jgi:hypothetical protein
VRWGTTARVSLVLSRDNSGDMDLGVIASDASHAMFYLGLTGDIQYLEKAGSACNTGEQWLNTGALQACGPRLQVLDPYRRVYVWDRQECIYGSCKSLSIYGRLREM